MVPGAAGPGYFVCHPGSSAERGMEEKRLPPEIFASLIASIHREFGLTALLIGGPEESALRAQHPRPGAGDACREAPSGSLAEVAGQIAGSRFFLGNDSGLMHVAAALGKRCAAFFGPTDERRTGPYGWNESLGPDHAAPDPAQGRPRMRPLLDRGHHRPQSRPACTGHPLPAPALRRGDLAGAAHLPLRRAGRRLGLGG